jgi:4-amino-4-deoxy-L-arabinose transferase-like glycosyltransferase
MNASPPLSEPALAAPTPAWVRRAHAVRTAKAVEKLLLSVAAVFYALHFFHLLADFPNHSAWMDWAKYTDEGWYGDAAIRHYQLGHWNVPGDFNPAAALPVWPLLELLLFRITGVSLVAARALTVLIFGLTLVCCYRLILRWRCKSRSRTLAPAIAVLLLAVSPFCFAFERMAILEPVLVLWMLLALQTASKAGTLEWYGVSWLQRLRERSNLPAALWASALGLLLPVMVLTKTTAVFLFPALLWMLWAACGYRLRQLARVSCVAGAVAAVVWGAYYGLFVRPHYLADYKYLFSANAYTGVTLATLPTVLHDTFFDTTWIGWTLFVLAVAAVLGSLVVLVRSRLRAAPLTGALLLWIFGYAAFLAYHDNLQPRYYLVIAVPLMMLVAIAFDAVLEGVIEPDAHQDAWLRLRVGVWMARGTALAGGAALAFAAVYGAWTTLSFVRHPEYSFLSAVHRVQDEVERGVRLEPGHSRLVLSISGSDISLMTGLPSICDDFGTLPLAERVKAYKPGWFATWNDVEDDKMDALAPRYRLVRVGAFPAFDDPERNLLILYRLDAVDTPGNSHGRGRRHYLGLQRRGAAGHAPITPLQQLGAELFSGENPPPD